ncbi:MAG TPA: sigma-54 dependent transcriptional regulator [Verrucomicrobiota bacterium]|nr:sigma-54 dependent transcriptional regulator [Verrucomicrobiota bacterium]
MKTNLKLLVVDDERNMRDSLKTVLESRGYQVDTVETAEDGLKGIESSSYFMVITDARLEGMSGYEFLRETYERWPDLPVLMITAYATPKLAVEAIQTGAIDYLSKPFEPEELLHSVNRCAERHLLIRQNEKLKARLPHGYQLDDIIGNCQSLKELREMIRTVGPTEATILILGESGTGKELIAGAIHHSSQRREETYVRLNCAAIPETLLESELFGHEKGSFTGAVKQKTGQVEEANGGTLFLDEIGEMSRSLQAKLLRFLEDGTFVRVGGTEELRVDVRIIAATNRDIIDAIENGDFREDLYHRLNVVQLRVSPLRDREGDVVLLAEHFLSGFGRKMNKQFQPLSSEVNYMLENHHWPGNVRELRNTMERAVILSTSDVIHPVNLPDFRLETRLRKEDDSASSYDGLSLEEALASFERDMIRVELARNDKNLSRTAQKLGISRHALRYRMTRLQFTDEADSEVENSPSDK